MTERIKTRTAGLPVFFLPEDREVAEAMAEAADETVKIVSGRWGLDVPQGCELRVLTDWREFVRDTAPALLRPLIAISRPLWSGRAHRAFELAGGWTVPWRGRPAVGVKPPRLLARIENPIGDRIFVHVPDLMEKVRQLTSHELTHAITAHLRLPAWLNEGLAMRAVDHLVGETTVLGDTRALLSSDPTRVDARVYRRIAAGDHDGLIKLYASGYWVTRYLDEERVTELRSLLRTRPHHSTVAQLGREAFQELRERNGNEGAP